MTIRRFELHRDEDATGVSGTGVVAEGAVFTDGTSVLRWTSRYRSTAVYASVADLDAIHGHHGATRIVWLDSDAPTTLRKVADDPQWPRP